MCENLKRRKVNLDEEDTFDILQLIQSSYSHKTSIYPANDNFTTPKGPEVSPSFMKQQSRVLENPEEAVATPCKTVTLDDHRSPTPRIKLIEESTIKETPNEEAKRRP